MFTSPQLIIEHRGPVVVLKMNRPERRNALGIELMVALADAYQMCDDDPEVRAIILTGAGDTFSSGSDLRENQMGERDAETERLMARFKDQPRLHWKALLREYSPKAPLIAAVEGFALGGGTEILQGTDIRVAGESAVFGVTEAALGLFPMGGSTVRLRRQIGAARAAELLFTAGRLDATTAERWGLINRVVEDGKALDVALEIAQQVAECGPLAVRAIKASFRAGDGLSEKEALEIEERLAAPVNFESEDAKEGVRAFFEKRKPVFQGR